MHPRLAALSAAPAAHPQPFAAAVCRPEAEVVPAAADLRRRAGLHDAHRQARVRWLALGQLLVPARPGRRLQAGCLPPGDAGAGPTTAAGSVQRMLNLLSKLSRIVLEDHAAKYRSSGSALN